jgi:hypothetical protein
MNVIIQGTRADQISRYALARGWIKVRNPLEERRAREEASRRKMRLRRAGWMAADRRRKRLIKLGHFDPHQFVFGFEQRSSFRHVPNPGQAQRPRRKRDRVEPKCKRTSRVEQLQLLFAFWEALR